MALNGALKLYCRILDRVVDGDMKLLGVLVVVPAVVVHAMPHCSQCIRVQNDQKQRGKFGVVARNPHIFGD